MKDEENPTYLRTFSSEPVLAGPTSHVPQEVWE